MLQQANICGHNVHLRSGYFVFSILILFNLFNTAFSYPVDTTHRLFNLDALNYYSPDSNKTRLDVYIEVPFTSLEFRKTLSSGDDFAADFDLTVNIKDLSGSVIFDKVYKEDLTTPNTEMKYLSTHSKIIIRNYFLPPGKYRLTVSIYEPGTKKSFEQEREITIQDFLAQPLTVSDIMMVAKLEEQGDRKVITPDVSRNVNMLDTTYLFFFVYKNNESARLNIDGKIFNSEKVQVFSFDKTLDSSSGLDIRNKFIIPIPVGALSYDKFTIDLTASTPDYKITSKSSFENVNKYFPYGLSNIDELIDELQYIASSKEISYMRDGKTLSEKQKRFLDFWKSKNPNPLSNRNEVMDEYYRRLRYANRRFSTSFTKGWKTDMGMVYIIFGEPSEIERHPYEMDSKPYEIWDYYELNRQFIFVDYSGFGEYRLITPIWETFNYH